MQNRQMDTEHYLAISFEPRDKAELSNSRSLDLLLLNCTCERPNITITIVTQAHHAPPLVQTRI